MTIRLKAFLVALTVVLTGCANTPGNEAALILIASPFANKGPLDECRDRAVIAYAKKMDCPGRQGSPLTRFNVDKEGALVTAMYFNRIDIFEEALALGADPMKQDGFARQTGLQCKENPADLKKYLLLLQRYGKISKFSAKFLHEVILYKCTEGVEFAFYFGASPESSNLWVAPTNPCYDAGPLCTGILATLGSAAELRPISNELQIVRQILDANASPDISKYESKLRKMRFWSYSDPKRIDEAWREIYRLLGTTNHGANSDYAS